MICKVIFVHGLDGKRNKELCILFWIRDVHDDPVFEVQFAKKTMNVRGSVI